MQTDIIIRMKDSTQRKLFFDLAARVPEAALAERLRKKASSLIGSEKAEHIWLTLSSVESLSARDIAALLNS